MRKKRNRILLCALPLAALTLAVAVFLTLFWADNKYNDRAPVLVDGAAAVDLADVAALTDGWTVYVGLLSPAETAAAAPAATAVRIGDEANLASYTGEADGQATYKITLSGNGACALFLPEVFTSSAVYAGGELLGGTGDVRAGTAFVRDGYYVFELSSPTDLVVQVAGGGHYYAGIYYPPLIGSPAAVQRAAATRLALYAAAIAFVLGATLLTLPLWLNKKSGRAQCTLLGLLTAASLAYPFFTAAGVALPALLYALTDTAAALALLCALTLAARMAGMRRSGHFLCGALPCGLALALMSAVMPFVLLALPGFAPAYGYLVSALKILLGGYIAAVAAVGYGKALKRGAFAPASALVTAGGFVYALLMIAGIATIGFFEPLLSFWYEEAGTLLMALLLGGAAGLEYAGVVRENNRLNASLTAEVARQTAEITALYEERKKLVRSVSHDVKTPIGAVKTYAEAMLARETLDDNTRRGLTVIARRLEDFSARFGLLEALEKETPSVAAPLCLNDEVARWLAENKDAVEMDGAVLQTAVCREKLTAAADGDKLARILENLVFNAVSFTPPDGTIGVTLKRAGECAELTVTDTGAGIASDALPRVFEPYYSSRGDGDERGLGLFIVRTLTAEMGGDVAVSSVPGRGAAFTVRLPLTDAAAGS